MRKTRAESVLPVWTSLVASYGSAKTLAAADEHELAAHLRPLGLHRIRARALVALGRALAAWDGEPPADPERLARLPHVGRYAANAFLSVTGKADTVAVDANVVRVLNRAFGLPIPTEVHKADDLYAFLRTIVPPGRARQVNLALVDLGALVCRPSTPRCAECPCRSFCETGRKTASVRVPTRRARTR